MNRRTFLKLSPTFLFPTFGGCYGWRPPIKESKRPRFICDGTGKNKITLLYNHFDIVNRKQTSDDCTAIAIGLGEEILQVVQRNWINEISTEIIHAGTLKMVSRSNEGIAIDEGIDFVIKYGNLFRIRYPINRFRNYDFRRYNYKLAERLINNIPEWLLEECKKHPIEQATKVTNFNEARDAVRNLQPVIIGSDIGFENKIRDKEGFAEPKGIWPHAWTLIGIDDKSPRKGGCIFCANNWVQGPKRHNQPDGSVWVDKDVLDIMLGKFGDSFAISEFR